MKPLRKLRTLRDPRERRRKWAGLLATILTLPLVTGCRRESDTPTSEDPTRGPTEVSAETDEELLRALGYIASGEIHEVSGVVRYDPAAAQPGWNLYVTQQGQAARLLDMDGDTLHVWHGSPHATEPESRFEGRAPQPWWRTVHLFPNGDLLAQTDFGSLARLDWDSNVLWVYRARSHHDFDVSPDGHIFVLTNSWADLAEFPDPTLDDFVVELDPMGNPVREVSILEALVKGEQEEALRELKRFQRETASRAAIDPLHTNSIEWLDGSAADRLPAFARGNLLISLPMIGRVAVLDPGAGRIVWSMPGEFRYQHHATMLANGNLLLFDNKGLGDDRSRILEIDPGTGEVVWSYGEGESETFYSECCGRVYRLENGNTLVVDSKSARAFELDPNHEIVWEFRSPHVIGNRAANLNDLIRLPVGASLLARKPR